ncbi:MAG: DMT family transporter [Elusimicrobia bacterium]|nr:DMT family transporter [Elusimicrobiota bacterium]
MTSTMWQFGLVYCAAVWGATFYMVKDALAGVDAVALVGYRFLLSAALLVPALARPAARGVGGWSAAMLKDSLGLAGLLLVLYASQTIGLRWTSAANSGFITGLFVLFVPALLFAFRGELPTLSQGAAVFLSVAGLWLLTGGLDGINRGDVLTLLSALTYAGHLLLTDRCVRAGRDTVWLAFHQFWMTAAAALLLCAASGASFAVSCWKTGGVIVFLAVVPTLSAFFIQLLAQRHVEPLRVSLIFSLEPVFAAAFAWTLGGESFRALSASGGGLIVLAMIVSDLSPRVPPEPAGAPLEVNP